MGHLKTGAPFFLPMNITIKLSGFDQLHLCITFANNVITAIDYSNQDFQDNSSQPDRDNSDFAKTIQQQVNRYFLDGQQPISLPCQISLGTAFQQKVWQALLHIPAGQVATYGALAQELKSSARAVGNACRNNRFPLIVPCHRVVSATGIGGYAGDTLEQQKGTINYLQIKQWLLAHEKAHLE